MSEQALDPAELEAIQAAMRQSAPAGRSFQPSTEVSSLSLFATDRDALAARPRLGDLAVRWAGRLGKVLRGYLGDIGVDAMGAELVDAPTVADELRSMWRALIVVEGRGTIVVAIGGGLVEAAAARRCGARQPGTSQRGPSPVSLRLFAPAGEAAMSAFEEAWTELDRTPVRREPVGPDAVAAALGKDSVLVATLAISGAATGRIRIYALPGVLTVPATARAPVAVDSRAIAAALGAVTVEVRVDLATMPMSLSELRALRPGSEITLPVFVDEPLPIYCGGVLKAWGRPVVSRGVLAVEISALATPGGGRP